MLTDETLESASDLTEVRFAWTVFQSVSAWPRSYHLATGWGTVIDIPREPLTIEDDAALRAVFARHGLRIG